MKQLLGIILGGGIGVAPGLIIGYIAWFPIRVWLFSQIPPEAQWAFWAKLATCIAISGTIGGTLPIWLTLVGGVLGMKVAAEVID